MKREPQTANVTAESRSRDILRFAVRGLQKKPDAKGLYCSRANSSPVSISQKTRQGDAVHKSVKDPIKVISPTYATGNLVPRKKTKATCYGTGIQTKGGKQTSRT